MDIYINIDEFYETKEYNRIISSLKNNGVEFKEFVYTKPPYNWVIGVNQEDRPKFIDYEEMPRSEARFLVSRVLPQRSEHIFPLTRRDQDNPRDFEKFTLNDTWKDVKNAKHLVIFKYANAEELIKLTGELKTKIYYIGKQGRYKMCIGYHPYIASKIASDRILYEKTGKELKGFRNISAIEADFNYTTLHRNYKLSGKYPETTYWMNGKKYPVIAPKAK
jgi:hypothetical protein